MRFTTLYTISLKLKSIKSRLISYLNDDSDSELEYSDEENVEINGKKATILKNYIGLFVNLVEEIFKINYIHLLDDDEKECIDFEYYFSRIIEKDEEDKHIPEIELFKLVSSMILFILYETNIPRNNKIYKDIVNCCNEVKNLKYYNRNDISISDVNINPLFLFDSDIVPSEVYNLVDSFISNYLLFNNNENDFIPEYLKQYLFSLEAIICIDILQLGKGYGDYELLELEEVDEDTEEYFREVYLLKSMIQVILTTATKLKNEFSNETFYNTFRDDCNVLLSL